MVKETFLRRILFTGTLTGRIVRNLQRQSQQRFPNFLYTLSIPQGLFSHQSLKNVMLIFTTMNNSSIFLYKITAFYNQRKKHNLEDYMTNEII